uniref:Uncharacterized protein n=2 Tax=Chrysotila carterae TaxID=13221 RepID=A0A7S4BDX1_CHRCT
MSEIDRLKEERRAARLAKEADGNAPTSSVVQDGEPKLEAGVRVTIYGLESEAGKQLNGQRGIIASFVEDSGRYAVKLDSEADRSVNVRRENLQLQSSVESAAPEAVEAVSGALAQLTALEMKAAELRDTLNAEQKTLNGLDLQDAEADESLDAIGKKVTAAAAAIAKLQVGLDELDLCELDDEARGAARTRRKALNATAEGSLQPLAAALSAQLATAKAGRN